MDVKGPLQGIFTEHFDDLSDNVVASPCEGGTLEIGYEARARTTSKPVGGFPVDPEPGEERWYLFSSVQLVVCGL